MKTFVTTVRLWILLLLSIVRSERIHSKSRNRQLEWISLVKKVWSARRLLARIVREDRVWVDIVMFDPDKGMKEYLYPVRFMDEDHISYNVQLLDVVVGKTQLYGWYYMKLTWGADSIPAPWVTCFYKLNSPKPNSEYMFVPYHKIVKAPVLFESFR